MDKKYSSEDDSNDMEETESNDPSIDCYYDNLVRSDEKQWRQKEFAKRSRRIMR